MRGQYDGSPEGHRRPGRDHWLGSGLYWTSRRTTNSSSVGWMTTCAVTTILMNASGLWRCYRVPVMWFRWSGSERTSLSIGTNVWPIVVILIVIVGPTDPKPSRTYHSISTVRCPYVEWWWVMGVRTPKASVLWESALVSVNLCLLSR